MRTFAMIAALAACGTITPPNGSGDDVGSGSGSDIEEPHPPDTLYGHVHDERGDTIDFSTNEPVHTHAGPSIDLSAGCPAVYKYAYLMDDQSPVFGRQTTTNPLAWHVMTDVASLDASATAYRVRADNGAVLLDWTPTAPDSTGIYTVELHRNGAHGIAALGTQRGKMYVDVRFRDTSGSETVDSACWEHHPLAVPLQIEQLETSDLFQMSLPADSSISSLMSSSVTVYSTQVIQHAGEAVTISFDGAMPTGHYDTKYVDDYVLDSTFSNGTATTNNCGDSPCPSVAPINPPAILSDGALAGVWTTMVVDDASGSPVSLGTSWTIPARAANEAPHAYHVLIRFSDLDQLQAPASMATGLAYGEFPVASLVYTGLPSSETALQCTGQGHHVVNHNGIDLAVFWCITGQHFTRVVALDHVGLQFEPFALTVTTAGEPAPYLPNSSVAIGARSWDAGDDGI